MKKEAAHKGLTPLDEEATRWEHLRAGAAASDLATVKDFLRFFVAPNHPEAAWTSPHCPDAVNVVANVFLT